MAPLRSRNWSLERRLPLWPRTCAPATKRGSGGGIGTRGDEPSYRMEATEARAVVMPTARVDPDQLIRPLRLSKSTHSCVRARTAATASPPAPQPPLLPPHLRVGSSLCRLSSRAPPTTKPELQNSRAASCANSPRHLPDHPVRHHLAVERAGEPDPGADLGAKHRGRPRDRA